jgi:segregation and condensation protein A
MEAIPQFSYKLPVYEGPLDLLLHLIEKAEVNIEDIFVSEITAQYLALMDDLSDVDMDKASAFLTVAAQLLLIKSRSLLPRPPAEIEDEENPEQQLLRQLPGKMGQRLRQDRSPTPPEPIPEAGRA